MPRWVVAGISEMMDGLSCECRKLTTKQSKSAGLELMLSTQPVAKQMLPRGSNYCLKSRCIRSHFKATWVHLLNGWPSIATGTSTEAVGTTRLACQTWYSTGPDDGARRSLRPGVFLPNRWRCCPRRTR